MSGLRHEGLRGVGVEGLIGLGAEGSCTVQIEKQFMQYLLEIG